MFALPTDDAVYAVHACKEFKPNGERSTALPCPINHSCADPIIVYTGVLSTEENLDASNAYLYEVAALDAQDVLLLN